jgi:methanol--5-hydroxybenzimidazolylcobamide Co-methyltransferase
LNIARISEAPGTSFRYRSLAVPDASGLVFGKAPRPVKCGFSLEIGAGPVFPEVNFTLPPIGISAESWPQILLQYEEMATQILRRAVAMKVPGLVLEFELLPAMTERPEWGAEITALLSRHLAAAHEEFKLPLALRVTPTDIRDQGKPPAMRHGVHCDRLLRSFELNIAAGADILSIESVGGKEVHDRALMMGDIEGIVFALGVLCPADMRWLWTNMVSQCAESGHVIAGGDSACGFANTAMQLAHQKMLPEVLAAVVRAMSAVRALAAFEVGAVGPSKDCAYEGPIMKAIAGVPISMEGKSAACAHFSPIGNIASAMCDLWSNESVQNVRLLAGNAPEVFTEALAYDCRLMNVATGRGQALVLRDWLTASDEWLSPQAAVLSPDATIAISRAIVEENDDYQRTIAAGHAAVAILREGIAGHGLVLSKKELNWLNRIENALDALPATGEGLQASMGEEYRGLFNPASYGL